MIKVEISNFQSIRHVAFEVDGFATILGRSNIGKSAIVRALHTALTGTTGTDFVRHDPGVCDRILRGVKKCKCFASVTVETPKLKFVWRKGDADNCYEVTREGKTEPFEGLDRGTPEFLLPDFEMVKVGDSKELIQIPSQFEPIFLLNKSGPAVADVLSDVARLDQINAAVGLVNKDRKDLVSKRKVREEDISGLRVELDKYVGLAEVNVAEIEQAAAKAEELEKKLAEVDSFIHRARSLLEAVKSLETALAPPLPTTEAESVARVSGTFLQATRFLKELAEKLPDVQRLTGIEAVEVPDPSFGPTLEAVELHDTFIVKQDAMQAAVERLEGSESVFLDDFPELNVGELLRIEGFITKATAALASQTSLSESLTKVEEELKTIVKALEEFGVCPTCTQPLGDHTVHLEAS